MTDYRELREAATFKECIVENSVMELRSTTILSLLDALAAAEARTTSARNDALEEAAVVLVSGIPEDGMLPEQRFARSRAAAIRVLKVKP